VNLNNPVKSFASLLGILATCAIAAGCSQGGGSSAGCAENSFSTCLTPKQSPEYYVEQSLKYFDTLDASASRESIPNYSELVARWEWPPWLKLTGIGREMMIDSDKLVVELTPSTVPIRDCRAFSVNPFGRCRVSFQYDGGPCPIYEEFTFNDQGEMTFIEAWSDLPGYLPMADEEDKWGEGAGVHRLSTKIPGLGKADGLIVPDGAAMRRAAARDAEIADFARRANDFYTTYAEELLKSGGSLSEDELYGIGCGWKQ
jgi:hypothetical protein